MVVPKHHKYNFKEPQMRQCQALVYEREIPL